jgi:hypothetical protein
VMAGLIGITAFGIALTTLAERPGGRLHVRSRAKRRFPSGSVRPTRTR